MKEEEIRVLIDSHSVDQSLNRSFTESDTPYNSSVVSR